ncbi:MAG: 6-phospho-3-hexuloisomerase [Candidatus Altiarchaeota archaeon]
MDAETIMRVIAEHVLDVTKGLDKKSVEDFIDEIKNACRVFVYGAGRSGMAARAFAMRLVQLGLTSYVVGETVTPAINKDDLLVLVSGSGETNVVLSIARAAKPIGVKIVTITSYPNSSLGKISDLVIKIKGKEKGGIEKDHLKHQIEGIHSSLTPLGTLFEDTTLVFFDGVVGKLMVELNKDETEMRKRHATI